MYGCMYGLCFGDLGSRAVCGLEAVGVVTGKGVYITLLRCRTT